MLNLYYLTHLVFFTFLNKESEVKPPILVPTKLVCQYRMTSRPDSTSNVTTQELVQLAIADSISEFRSCNRYKLDSLKLTYRNTSVDMANVALVSGKIRSLPRYKFDGIIIKRPRAKMNDYYGIINKILYKYEESSSILSWQILPETMQVSGYNCQKATTKLGGRNYTAWFTRQIAASDGPYMFNGLPGLIISIKDDTNSYSFELTRIYQPSTKYFIRLPKEVMNYNNQVIITTRDKYYEAYYTAQKNRIDNMTADGSFVYENEEQVRKNYQEKLKRRNNPLELR